MSKRYYSDNNLYPYAVKSVVERVLIYFANILYPNEDYQTQSSKRFILSDTSDDSNAIRRSIDIFKNSQGQFPFTAYSINDDSPLDYKSHYQLSGNYYSDYVGAYISFVPMNLDLFFTTYFTTPYDFWRGMTLFAIDEASITRLEVPVIINNIPSIFTIDLTYTTERGQLAFDIEQQFNVGKIYPVIHSVTVKCAYISLASNNTTDAFGSKIVYPVDDIIFHLSRLTNEANLDQNPNIAISYSPATPIIQASIPINNSLNIARDSSIIITFNVAMNEDSVLNSLDMVPYCDKDMFFDATSKILTINPRDNFLSNTQYTILINNKAKSGNLISLEEDYKLVFTTGT